jgi:putative ABC transport system permease protein
MEDAVRDFGVKETIMFAANLEPNVSKEQIVERARAALSGRPIDIADVRELKHDIQQGFFRLLLLASTVAYAAMAVASIGVTNTIMASIRSRRWQFGILRAIGVTRGELLRLVIGEALLLGGVGAAMGLGAGAVMTINARRATTVLVGFTPKLDIPGEVVAIGIGIVMLVSLLASLWPAIHVARAQPLALLQAGRASA